MTLYLNHAGTSWPKPRAVRDALAAALDSPPHRWADDFTQAHEAVAAAFGVAPDTLLPTPGATSALAAAVASLPWQEGDRVLTSGMEHQALIRPLEGLRGVDVVEIPRGAGPLDLEVLRRELLTAPARLVAVSVATNVTGEILPYREVIELAHAHGASCLLDGAQAAGWLPLDLTDLGVDYFAFAGHKGPQAPYGVGGLYVRPGLARPGYCDTGSVDRPSLVALAAGLATMAERAPLSRAREVEAAFRSAAMARPGVRALGTEPRVPTCALVVEGRDPAALAGHLARHSVIVRGGTHCAPRAHHTLGVASTLRFSFGPDASLDDADRAAKALGNAL